MWFLLALLVLATPASAAELTLTPLESVQVRVTNMVNAQPLDWLGLFTVGAPHQQWEDWYRLNGTNYPASTGLTTGGATFKIPPVGGPWEIRLFKGTGYQGWVATMPLPTGPTVTIEMGPKFTGFTGEPRCRMTPPITVTTDLTCTAVFAP